TRFDDEASLDHAIALLEGLVASEPDSAPVEAALARALIYKYRLVHHRDWETRASAACHRATTLDADAPEVLVATGELHVAAGRHAEGLESLERALERRPDLIEARIARALALDGL